MKKYAISTIGYVICILIILGMVMIISAPMLIEKFEADKNKSSKLAETYQSQDEIGRVERNMNSKFEELSLQISELQSGDNISSSAFNCSLEGTVDENGDVSPINSSDEILKKKIVLVCEYRQ